MMMEQFQYITGDGIYLNVTLGEKLYIFEGNAEHLVLEYYKGQSKGLKWSHDGYEVQVFEKGCKITGYPTHDCKGVIAIYPSNHESHPAPHNAVLYNVDGTICKKFEVPALISPTAKVRKERAKYSISDDASFSFVRWAKDSHGNTVTTLQIDFDWDWWEERVCNTETGEFGECLSSGRR